MKTYAFHEVAHLLGDNAAAKLLCGFNTTGAGKSSCICDFNETATLPYELPYELPNTAFTLLDSSIRLLGIRYQANYAVSV